LILYTPHLTIALISGCASEINRIKEEQALKISNKTMGQLVAQFVEKMSTMPEANIKEPETLEEPWVHIEFNIECSNDYYEERKSCLAMIVSERNELIHHFSSKYDLNSIHDCEKAVKYLNQQRENAILELECLQNRVKNFKKACGMAASFWSAAEFDKLFGEMLLNQSRIVQLLCDFAKNKMWPGGWASLSSAGNFIKQNEPDELDSFKERYGYKKLKELVLATNLFDVREESIEGGGYRVMFRAKSDLF
jgi:OST-HTH/LOTUS domain